MKTKTEIKWDKFINSMDEAIQKLNKLLPPKAVSAKTLMLRFYYHN